MEISINTTIPYGRKDVFETMRDKLPEMVKYLPNVDSITVKEKQELNDIEIKFVNEWKAANTEVPKVARAFIDPNRLTWKDKAHWNNEQWTCQWQIEVGAFAERVNCKGTTYYVEKGDNQTEIQMRGVLELSLKGLLPGLIAKKATPAVEGFVVKLIQPNLQKSAEAVEQYLDDNK